MLNLNHGKRLLRRFKKNEDGNMAVTFALSAVAVIGTMGAAMDYSVLSNAAARGQAIAAVSYTHLTLPTIYSV